MLRGLQITMRGEQLRGRIDERIKVLEAAADKLDSRITQRSGDASFDVRPEDDFKTVPDLEQERQHYRDRALRLTLLRDNLVLDETYALNKRDLRLAELITPDACGGSPSADDRYIDVEKSKPAILGLKLSLRGHQVRELLIERIEAHARRAEWWTAELNRTPEEQTEEKPLLPDQMCEHEAERHAWRAEVLRFLHDHVDESESYLIGEEDLEFGELLPEKPGIVEQADHEDRNRLSFQLERLTKGLSRNRIDGAY